MAVIVVVIIIIGKNGRPIGIHDKYYINTIQIVFLKLFNYDKW